MYIDIVHDYLIDRDFITLIMIVKNDDKNLMNDSQFDVEQLSSGEPKDCSTSTNA